MCKPRLTDIQSPARHCNTTTTTTTTTISSSPEWPRHEYILLTCVDYNDYPMSAVTRAQTFCSSQSVCPGIPPLPPYHPLLTHTHHHHHLHHHHHVVEPRMAQADNKRSRLQALVYDILPSLEEGAGKRCSECPKNLEILFSPSFYFLLML